MTRKECEYIKKILQSIRPEDERVQLGIVYVDKQLAIFNAQRGQIKDQREADYSNW